MPRGPRAVSQTRWSYRLPETKTSTNVTERNQRFGEGSGADYLLTGETPDVSLGQLPRPGWQTACRPFPCAESSIAEYFFQSFIEEMKHEEDECVGRPLNLGLVSIAMLAPDCGILFTWRRKVIQRESGLARGSALTASTPGESNPCVGRSSTFASGRTAIRASRSTRAFPSSAASGTRQRRGSRVAPSLSEKIRLGFLPHVRWPPRVCAASAPFGRGQTRVPLPVDAAEVDNSTGRS